MNMHNSNSNSIDEMVSLLHQLLSEYRSEIQELKKRVDIIEGKPPHSPIFDAPITVIFPNGDKIAETIGIRTFTKTIEKIGIEKVKKLNILALIYERYPLISDHRYTNNGIPDYSKQERIGQYYIWKNSDTSKKVECLNEISDRLNLDLKIHGKTKPKGYSVT